MKLYLKSGLVVLIVKAINFFLKITPLKIIFNRQQGVWVTFQTYDQNDKINELLHNLVVTNLNEEFFFIQIGANDGISFDPLHRLILKYNLNGICIEPIKEYYDQLCNNYKSRPNIKLVNIAIHDSNSELSMYKVSESALKILPTWAKGIASIDKKHHLRSNTPKEYIEEVKVQTISFQKFLVEYNIGQFDLLLIDTEGYDLEILKSINLTKNSPKIIYFEHLYQFNGIPELEFTNIITHLMSFGYLIYFGNSNILAYKPQFLSIK